LELLPVSPWIWISGWLFQGSDLRHKVDSQIRDQVLTGFGSAFRNWNWFLQDRFDFLGQVQVFLTGKVSQDRIRLFQIGSDSVSQDREKEVD
jgi:hypothetical protein